MKWPLGMTMKADVAGARGGDEVEMRRRVYTAKGAGRGQEELAQKERRTTQTCGNERAEHSNKRPNGFAKCHKLELIIPDRFI